MEEKFKADPYNPNNKLISESDILNIMKSLDIQDFKVNNLSGLLVFSGFFLIGFEF